MEPHVWFLASVWSEGYLLGRVRLFTTPWTVANQAPLFMGSSRQEYWSGLPFAPQAFFPTQGLNPYLMSPALAGRFFITSATWQVQSSLLIYKVTVTVTVNNSLYYFFFCSNICLRSVSWFNPNWEWFQEIDIQSWDSGLLRLCLGTWGQCCIFLLIENEMLAIHGMQWRCHSSSCRLWLNVLKCQLKMWPVWQ